MTIVSIYASLLAFLFVYLSIRTIRLRRSLGIALGHEENPDMLRAMRVQANCAEYVPIALLLIFLVESLGSTPSARSRAGYHSGHRAGFACHRCQPNP